MKKKTRLSRKELEPKAKLRILNAAAYVVGDLGYDKASMKRIAEVAGIAEGSIYLYFKSRSQLMDELLPYVGTQMRNYIAKEIAGLSDLFEIEDRGFRAFFKFVKQHKGFFRILNEAESSSPVAHKQHFNLLGDAYVNSLRRGIETGAVKNFAEDEIEAVAYMLMAARSYLYLRYLKYGKEGDPPLDKVADIYSKFLRSGL